MSTDEKIRKNMAETTLSLSAARTVNLDLGTTSSTIVKRAAAPAILQVLPERGSRCGPDLGN